MAPAERRISGEAAPKSDDGNRIGWKYNSNLGCAENNSSRAHIFIVIMNSSRRLRNYPWSSVTDSKNKTDRLGGKIGDIVRDIRKIQQNEMGARRAPLAARDDNNPNSTHTLRVDGVKARNLPELERIDYIDQKNKCGPFCTVIKTYLATPHPPPHPPTRRRRRVRGNQGK